MAAKRFTNTRVISYGQSGGDSYIYCGSGRIGVTEDRKCQSPGFIQRA